MSFLDEHGNPEKQGLFICFLFLLALAASIALTMYT